MMMYSYWLVVPGSYASLIIDKSMIIWFLSRAMDQMVRYMFFMALRVLPFDVDAPTHRCDPMAASW